MKVKNKKQDSTEWEANEPLADYLNSEKYINESKTITISSFKEQEESNYEYYQQLTPGQRLELHYWLITGVFGLRKEEYKVEDEFSIKITQK